MSHNTPTRVAVVGAGSMGRNHLRIYDMLKDVELVGVVDASPEAAAAAASTYGCDVFDSVEALVGNVDAVSIAVPTAQHAEVGKKLLAEGIHCLIEKPLAVTERQCRELIATAEANDAVLLVGHVERFNPAVVALADMIDKGAKVQAVDARRMSYSSRIVDVDVVLDLMIHDLDIILALVGDQRVASLAAHGVHRDGRRGRDYVSALISFEGGAMASATASRITQNKVRTLSVTTDIGYVTLDYVGQELLVHRQERDTVSGDAGAFILDLTVERVLVRRTEPLLMELRHFLDCVRDGATPIVGGRDALAALELVWAIQESVRGRPALVRGEEVAA